MALPSNVQWEIRTGGSDSNGGGFVSGGTGTDYSLQNGAQVTFDGVTIAAHTAGVTATIIITGYTVATTDKDNLVQITGGLNFTTGFYHVQSVNVGANTWTLDRNSCTGAASGMTGAMGGGLLTVSKPIASLNSSLLHTIWVQSGTYTVTAVAIDLTGVTSVTGLTYQGYQTTHGDNTGTKPLITTATNSTKLVKCRGAANLASVTFRNITFSNTAGTRDDGIYASTEGEGGAMLVDLCVFDGLLVGIRGDFSTDYYWRVLYLNRSEFKNCTSHGVSHDGSTVAHGCWSHGNAGDGFSLQDSGGDNSVAASMVLVDCVASGNNYGARQGGGAQHSLIAINCVFYNNTLDGLNNNLLRSYINCVNCIFDSNGAYGLSANNAPGISITLYNAFRNNTTASHLNVPSDPSDITLSAGPFTSAGSDFSLNNTAGGGAALKAVGYPGVTSFGTGNIDVGALQSAGSGGSTTTYVIAPNQTRIIGNEEN